MYFARLLTENIKQVLSLFPVILVTGARQTGKTTLLRESFPQYAYVSLDLPGVARQAEENPEDFFAEHPAPLIIDEVQYAPSLFRYLKVMVDAERHRMGTYILTGSQKFPLMAGVSESLAGRIAVMELEGMSWAEASSIPNAPSVTDFIWRGSFPELYRQPDLPKEAFFENYVSTYLERDLRQILNVGSLRDFERFLRVLATRNAQQLDMTAAGKAVGISSKTAGSWISVLEASGQISLLEPWFGNVGKRIVKTPKLYFNDTGLVSWLLGLDAATWTRGPFLGPLWEGLVYAELRRLISSRGLHRKLYYYRDNQGLEVDFLVMGGGSCAIEAKATAKPQASDASALLRFAALAESGGDPSLKPFKAFIIGRNEARYPVAKGGPDPAQPLVTALGLGELLKALT